MNLPVKLEMFKPELSVNSFTLLHGTNPDGYIFLYRKDATGRMETIGAMPVQEINQCFPAIVDHLVKDSYHTINTFYGAHWHTNKLGLHKIKNKEEHHLASRCKENLRWLNACFVDLDCGRSEQEAKNEYQKLSWRFAAAVAGELMEEKVIPEASIIARSGRGIYLFWKLCDDQDRTLPAHAYGNNRILCEAINKELNIRLERLASDKATSDATRLCRIHGSIHSGADSVATYLPQYDQYKKLFVYTLHEMAKFLNINHTDTLTPSQTTFLLNPAAKWARKTKNPGSQPGRKKSFWRLYAKRAQDILTLEQHRGGFLKKGMQYPDGHFSQGRNFVLTLYAECLRCQDSTQAETLAAVKSMAASCTPKYPSDLNDTDPEIIVETVFSKSGIKPWSNDRLCYMLGIDINLAEQLQLETIKPTALKELQKRERQKEPKTKEENFRRLALLHMIHAEPHIKIPLRQLSKRLAARGISNRENGKPYSYEVIRKDLAEIKKFEYEFLEWRDSYLAIPEEKRMLVSFRADGTKIDQEPQGKNIPEFEKEDLSTDNLHLDINNAWKAAMLFEGLVQKRNPLPPKIEPDTAQQTANQLLLGLT